MRLQIYSLKNKLFDGEAESINCETASGQITVLDDHRPLISMLKGGTIKIVDINQKEVYIPVSSGFLEVLPRNHARLIVEET
ncbi:MAG: F0F1 ATP synthase subunit epsilon [bacterium]|nr:F0F1 ATP synthase subunit epsilon [bacterium]